MQELSVLSQIGLYVLLTVMGLLVLIIWGWQIMVFRGRAMKNPDGSSDDCSLRHHLLSVTSHQDG